MIRFVTGALLVGSLSALAASACSKDEETQPARQRDGGGTTDAPSDAPTGPIPRETPAPTWTKTFGSPNRDVGTSIAISSDGIIAITGIYEGGALPFGPVTIAPGTPSARDAFVGFFDDKGEPVRGYGFTNGVAFVQRGRDKELVVSGSFAATAQIGGTTLASNGERDAFVAWFGEGARLDHAASFGSIADEDVKGAQALRGDGRVVLAGEGAFVLGDGGVSEPAQGRSIFALEVSRGGSPQWLSTAPLGATVWSCGIGKEGIAALIAGAKAGDDLGGGPMIGSTTTAQGAPAFVRYSKEGVRERASLLPNQDGQQPSGGNVLFGEGGEMYFVFAQAGSLLAQGTELAGSGGVTAVRIEPGGEVKWVARFGGPHQPTSPRIVRDDTGDLFVLSATTDAKAAALYRIASDTGATRAISLLKLPDGVASVVDIAPAADGSWALIANGTGAAGTEDIIVARYPSL